MSATALLGSPDGSRHPLDVYEFAEEDYRNQNENEGAHYQNGRSGTGLWECLVGCRHRLDQQIARRRVSLLIFTFLIEIYFILPVEEMTTKRYRVSLQFSNFSDTCLLFFPTRKKIILEVLPNSSEIEDMRKIR